MAHDITKDVIGCKELEIQKVNQSGEPAKFFGSISEDEHLVTKKYVDDKKVESFPTSLTVGSVVFSDGTNLTQDNANLFWNNASKELQPNRIRIEADGTQANPALKFNDTNTGFFKSGDSVNLSINNSTKWTIDGSGNLTTLGTGHDQFSDFVANEHLLPAAISHDDLIAGTIASHDTGATGTELDTLTDNSMADALHRHSELSASDGTPDASFALNDDGQVTMTTSAGSTNLLLLDSRNADNKDGIIEINSDRPNSGDVSAQLSFKNNAATRNAELRVARGTTDAKGIMTFLTSNSQAITIDENQNVGFGTVSPVDILEAEKNQDGVTNVISRNTDANTNAASYFRAVNDAGATGMAMGAMGTGSFTSGGFAPDTGVLIAEAALSGGLSIMTRADTDIRFYTNGHTNQRMVIDNAGNVGIGTVSPTQPLSVKEKSGMSAIGGICIKMTNKTGSNTVAGQLVQTDTTTNDAFATSGANSDDTIGIVLEAGVSDGSQAWVVISGIADVLMDGGGSTRGDRIISSATAGSGLVWNVGGAVATHFQEIGHCIETRGGAGLARCVLHFN